MLTRRNFIAGTAGLAALLPEQSQILKAFPAAASDVGKVKITGVKTASVMIKYPAHLVKIETDSGLYGIGEAFNRGGVLDHIGELKSTVIGEDPLQVDYLYTKMAEAKLGHGSWTGTLSGAIAGIEMALWDLAGKILNVPVYVLLGGKFRDKILVYHDTGSPATPDPAAWVEEAEKSLAFGFKATKFDMDWEGRGLFISGKGARYRQELWNRGISTIEMEQWVKILEAIRARLGEHYPLGIDLHFNYNYADALKFSRMVEHLNLWFIEDPIPPQNADAMARYTRECKIPTVTGENLYSRHTFREFIEKQACDIIQPDPQKSGGLLETKKIADWADLYYITFACHNMCTPVGTVGNAHACAAIRSFIALESDSVDLPHWADLIHHDGPFYRDGYYELTDKPGLGIELNDEVCRRHLAEGSAYFG
jgi:L-alanine-DL-glutamate epimerase-like enolase superfamily enzyme